MWQLSVYIAWSFARFCLNRQRSSGSVKGKYTKYRLHIAPLLFYALRNMRSQISSPFLRHGHLPIREVNCYRRPFQFAFSSSSSSNLFFRMIARTFGKFPPQSVANGWETPKTAIQTRWFSIRYCYSATSDPKTWCCSLPAWSSHSSGYFFYSWFWESQRIICKLI